ncbi:Multicopper oxidase, type 1 [Corchorus olitorius]|uniref:Multicopper oxidase, type 1 n=1 Tax=Corchorus olitorius TaxID=93759 RepID=A0A1R3KAM5_9ROSI|nr:Multicopper oxidase, type 1 [Corchorus olitorius]
MIIMVGISRILSLILLVSSCIFICLSTVPAAATTERKFTWEISYQYKSLECYKKLAVAINGMTPGPTISAEQGDTIVVDVINNLLMENVAIHWHGIRQRGTPWSDGTDGVTQCAIMPGETYTYRFVVDRAGTFMYHSHYGLQREAGLYGLINVSLPVGVSKPFNYDFDRGIILSDWFHHSAYQQAAGLASIPFRWVGEPQSLLINGRGNYSCSGLAASVCNSTNPECLPSTITVISGKTYRLRIASLTSLSALSFQIEDHEMTVVEADGQYVEPFVVKNLYIYSGETYSVLVKANQDSSRNYWTSINVISRQPKTPNGLAIFNYYPNHFHKFPSTNPPLGPLWNDTKSQILQSRSIKARQGFIVTPPKKADRVIVLLNTQNTIDGYIRWSLNNVSHTLPSTPLLIAMKENITDVFDPNPPPEDYDDSANYDIYSVANNTNANSSSSIYRLEFDSTVDIILQNANSMTENVRTIKVTIWLIQL